MTAQSQWIINNGEMSIVVPGDVWENLTSDYGAAIRLNGGTVIGGGIAGEQAIFLDNQATLRGGAVYNDQGIMILQQALFSGNTASEQGGAVNATSGSSLTFSGVTFSGNTAANGGAIFTNGELILSDAVFNGNQGYGGAFYTVMGEVIFRGKVTLATETDTIENYQSTFTIDADAFGDGAYYQVIDAVSASQWSPVSGAAVIGGYTKITVGDDLYIKSNTADFSTAVFSNGGTSSAAVIAGETFTGVAYDYALEATAKSWGATNLVYDGLAAPVTSTVTVADGNGYHVRNGEFKNAVSASRGGAIYSEGGDISFEQVNFSGNSADQGGAISLKNGTLTLSGVTFSGNSAAAGGAILQTGGTLTLADVRFDGNVSPSGGAFYVIQSQVFFRGKVTLATETDTIENYQSTFTIDADAFGDGAYYQVIDAVTASQWSPVSGAAVIGGYTKITVGDDLYIKSNTADFSTAVFSNGGTSSAAVIAGETFTGVAYDYALEATAKSWGATNLVYDGLAAPVTSTVTVADGNGYHVRNGEFKNAVSTWRGGAIYSEGGDISFEQVNFSGNTAAEQGGAINLKNGTLTLAGVTFTGNTSVNGGAVMSSGNTLTLADVVFDGNSGYGGAFYVIQSQVFFRGKVTLAAETDTIENYQSTFTIDADAFGDGAYYLVIDAVSASQWSPVSGAAVTGGYSTVTAGSDLYIKSNTVDFSTAILSDGGTATSAVIAGATYTGVAFDSSLAGSVKNFGATTIAIDGTATPITSRTDVAAENGYHVRNGEFKNAVSTWRGGAIYSEGGALSFEQVNFSGNTAAEQGGAINLKNGTLTLAGVTFTGNTSVNGGAVMSSGNTLTLADVVFDGNSGYGGAFYVIQSQVFFRGKVTLAAATDTIENYQSTFTIDADAFGTGAYYQVIDAVSASQWSPVSGAAVTGGYSSVTAGSDLYIKSNTVDFSTAILSDGGTATSAVIAGATYTGVAFDSSLAGSVKNFGATTIAIDGTATPITSRTDVAAENGYHVRNSEFRGIVYDGRGSAVNVQTGGNASFEKVVFTGNTASEQGGAIHQTAGSMLTLQGVTFSGNAAENGGAVMSYGTLILADVVFDGNTAVNGGAFYSLQGTVIFKGKVTLKNAADTIADYGSTFTIDSDAFGTGDYYQVIEASSDSQWAPASKAEVTGSGNYGKTSAGGSLYIKNNDIDFSTAILTEAGTATSLVIAGETFTGYAFTNDNSVLAGGLGAENFATDGMTTDGNCTISTTTANSSRVFALKNAGIGGNFYSIGNSRAVNGDVTLLAENSRFAGTVYAAGTGAVNGDITIQITGSTIGGNLSPTASSQIRQVGKATAEVSNSRVNGTIRGTGSSGQITVGAVAITLTDSYAGEIIAGYGNQVSGNAAITLSGATVGTDIRRFGSGKANTIAGTAALTVTGGKITSVANSIYGMDTVTIEAGAELQLTAGGDLDGDVAGAGILTSNGALTFTGSTLGMGKLVNNGTITVNGKLADGTYTLFTYGSDWTLGTITAGANGELYHSTEAKKYYYYNAFYVDSSLTGSEGQEVQITVGGKSAMAIYGVNAFTGSDAAKAAAAKTGKDFCIIIAKENISGNYYGDGNTKISDGSVAKTTYGGKLVKTGEAVDTGDTQLSVAGGTFGSMVVGGNRVSVDDGSAASVISDTVTLKVTGGVFSDEKGYLAAAGYVVNDGNNESTAASLSVNTANLTLDGEEVKLKKYAFGGAFAANGTATVETVNVVVANGTYESVFAGGWAQNNGAVNVAGATVNISGGSIRNLYAGGTDSGGGNTTSVNTAEITVTGGTIRTLFLNGKYSRDTVNTATLNVTGECEINWIEGLCHSMIASSASTVTTLNIGAGFTVEDILDVDVWNFTKAGALVEFGTHTADLNGTLEGEKAVKTVIDFQIGEQELETPWTAVAAAKFEGLVESSIKINGNETVFADNVWSYGSYTVTLDEKYDDTRKALIVTKTA